MGADGVLINSAIALADDPIRMAKAMDLGVNAGRMSFLAGRIRKAIYANPSSPEDNISK